MKHCSPTFAHLTVMYARLCMHFSHVTFAHALKKLRKSECANVHAQMLNAQKHLRKNECANVGAQCFMHKCHQPRELHPSSNAPTKFFTLRECAQTILRIKLYPIVIFRENWIVATNCDK